jgi:hypothetical protein
MVANYANAKIYKIVSEKTERLYVGATTTPLLWRMQSHIAEHQAIIKGTRRYGCTSGRIIKYGDARIELIEAYPCENKIQLDKREAELIAHNMPNAVNVSIPGREKKVYMKSYSKKYMQDPVNRKRKMDQQRLRRAKNKHLKTQVASVLSEMVDALCNQETLEAVKDEYKPNLNAVCHIKF